MARDRKRAKQRRERQARAAGTQGRRVERRAAPAVEQEHTSHEHEPPELASGDMDLVDAQLALGRSELADSAPSDVPDVDEDVVDLPELAEEGQFEQLEDEVDAAEERFEAGLNGDDGGTEVAERAPRAPRKAAQREEGNRFTNFLRGSWRELERVQWPDRQQCRPGDGRRHRLRHRRRRLPRPDGLPRHEDRQPHRLSQGPVPPHLPRRNPPPMFRWYVVNTYSGHENKVKHNLEHRVVSLGQKRAVRQVVVPTETVSEMKDNQKVVSEKRTMPGYVLVNMDLNEDSWALVKGTPGVTGFVGASNEPVPLTQAEVDRLLHRETAERPRTRAQFSIGESVKVISGPLSDFSGEISEINEDGARLKVLVSIFGRETPVEVGFDQVKKI